MPNFYFISRFYSKGALLLCCLVLVHAVAWGQAASQRFTLTGRVVDATGQGRPGATVLLEILRNRNVELAFQGFRLPDSRRFGRPGPGGPGAERNRNFYPHPCTERENNSPTPADPAI